MGPEPPSEPVSRRGIVAGSPNLCSMEFSFTLLRVAKHAETLAPDAVIAMPPTIAKSQEDYREYFRALGKVTSRPVIVQTTGGARDLTPSTDLIKFLNILSPITSNAYSISESAAVTHNTY